MIATHARTAARLVVLLLAAAALLRVLDAVPRALTGLPRGVQAVRDLETAARLGLSLPLPSVPPLHLEWPPSRVAMTRDRHALAVVRRASDGAPWLLAASAPASAPVISPALLPPGEVLQDVDVESTAGPAMRVQRLGDTHGVVWHQASWQSAGRRMVLRYRGPLGELLRMAATLRSRSRG